MTGTTEVPTMEDYIKSRPQLGLLELYEFCCQELNKNIINGREFMEISRKTSKSITLHCLRNITNWMKRISC